MAKGDSVNIYIIYFIVVVALVPLGCMTYSLMKWNKHKPVVSFAVAGCLPVAFAISLASVFSPYTFAITSEAYNEVSKVAEIVSPNEMVRYGGSSVRRTVVATDEYYGVHIVIVRVIFERYNGSYDVVTCCAIASEDIGVGTDVTLSYVSMRDHAYRPYIAVFATPAKPRKLT